MIRCRTAALRVVALVALAVGASGCLEATARATFVHDYDCPEEELQLRERPDLDPRAFRPPLGPCPTPERADLCARRATDWHEANRVAPDPAYLPSATLYEVWGCRRKALLSCFSPRKGQRGPAGCRTIALDAPPPAMPPARDGPGSADPYYRPVDPVAERRASAFYFGARSGVLPVSAGAVSQPVTLGSGATTQYFAAAHEVTIPFGIEASYQFRPSERLAIETGFSASGGYAASGFPVFAFDLPVRLLLMFDHLGVYAGGSFLVGSYTVDAITLAKGDQLGVFTARQGDTVQATTQWMTVGVGAGVRYEFQHLYLRVGLAHYLRKHLDGWETSYRQASDGERRGISEQTYGNATPNVDAGGLMFDLALGIPFKLF